MAHSSPPKTAPLADEQIRRRRTGAAPDGRSEVIRVRKTADLIAAHIRGLIIRGELQEGDYLQSEAQLLIHFATSRPTLREAIRILENEGLITTTRGSRSGARVHRPSVDNVARYAGFALQADGATLGDLYEARLAIEPYAAGLAAERRDAQAIAGVREEYARLCALLEAKESITFRERLAHFHIRIVDASGNKTLSLMNRLLHLVLAKHQRRFRTEAMLKPLNAARRREFYSSGMARLEKIGDLIEAGERAEAEAFWRGHLEHSNQVWLTGYDRNAVVDLGD